MSGLFLSGSAPVDFSLNTAGEFNNLLLKALSKEGFEIGPPEKASVFLNINHERKFLHNLFQNSRIPKVLIRTEPISVFPAQYTKRVEDLYDFVVTTGLPKRKTGKFLELPHPYQTKSNPNLPHQIELETQIQDSPTSGDIFTTTNWNRRGIFLSLIAANKVSSQNDNNYALRRRFANDSVANNLEIYGMLWNDSLRVKIYHRAAVGFHALRHGTIPNLKSLYGGLHKYYGNYKGAPRDKQVIIRESKFSLVIENSNTYVSEKLFDALIGGSIPIYYGPDLSMYGISEEFLVIRHEGTLGELKSRLENIGEKEIFLRLIAIKQFVESVAFQNEWDAKSVFQQIAKEISKLK
jgi:hypothetical protein